MDNASSQTGLRFASSETNTGLVSGVSRAASHQTAPVETEHSTSVSGKGVQKEQAVGRRERITESQGL